MFVYSIRGSTVKFFGLIILTLAVLVGVLSYGSSGTVAASVGTNIDFDGIRTNEDRLEFLSSCGIEIAGEPTEEKSFSVPSDFDLALARYNEIQKAQGLDLSNYKNKKVTRYTYEIADYEGTGHSAFVNLIVHRGRIIACDVSAVGADGFVKPLIK